MEIMGWLSLLVVCLPLAYVLVGLCWNGAEVLVNWIDRRRRRRVARVEAELDRAQAQLRSTILSLADQLGADAHEARKALIREAYLASGQVPEE